MYLSVGGRSTGILIRYVFRLQLSDRRVEYDLAQDEIIISVRIPILMRDMLREAVAADTHMNISEFVRDAIRKQLELQKQQRG